MVYKIEIGKTVTDKRGKILASSTSVKYVEGNITSAYKEAENISTRLPKSDVSVHYDDWCIYAFKAGKLIFKNKNYFK